MNNINSTLLKKSRFVSGGTTEVSTNKLEWWNRNNYTLSGTETVFYVTEAFVGRLDNIAAFHYNDSKLWWVIAMVNNILDPFTEVVVGRKLYVPSKTEAVKLIGGKMGGIPSQREIPPMQITPIV